MLAIISFLYWNLFVLKDENSMLKSDLDTTKADCALLIETNSSISQELEKVKSELQEVKKENLQWSSKYNQYPAATIAWIYMTEELGWSNFVAAGIIGNMMAECGGQTLALDWDINGNSGYGLFQWIGNRRISIKSKYGEFPTVVEQIEFMKDELYGTNGVTQQVTDQQREAILNANSPEKCAAKFAMWFERPASTDYSVRKSNAIKAYKYFCRE